MMATNSMVLGGLHTVVSPDRYIYGGFEVCPRTECSAKASRPWRNQEVARRPRNPRNLKPRAFLHLSPDP